MFFLAILYQPWDPVGMNKHKHSRLFSHNWPINLIIHIQPPIYSHIKMKFLKNSNVYKKIMDPQNF